MRTAEQIARLYGDRQKARNTVMLQMESVRDQYNGDVVLPMPQFQDTEQQAYVANMLQIGLDNYARRIASTDPDMECPPKNSRSATAQEKADKRRRIYLGWWEASNVGLQRFRRSRHLIGYAGSPVSQRPDLDRGIPIWVPRNPLSTFTAPCVDPDNMCPADAVFSVKMPLKQVNARWPHAAAAYCGSSDDLRNSPDRLVTILEYDDPEQIAYVLVGNAENVQYHGASEAIFLSRTENRAGMCLTVHPQRINLDRPQGQFDGIMGMWQMQSKLMGLEVMAVQKGVFPDMYIQQTDPNRPAKIISGPHPGWTGKYNEIDNGTVEYKSIQPGFQTNPTIDRLERAQRLEAGISPEFGGESGTNIRTGRRGDSILSALVDYPIQEAQTLLGKSNEEEIFRASKIATTWFADRPQSFYVRWKGAKGWADYTPSKDIDSHYATVSYPMVGSDVQNLTIGVGQLVSTEMMSKETGRRLHPWVSDPDLEGDRVVAEKLQAATLASIESKAASGELPVPDAARIEQLVVEQNMKPYAAIMQAQKEAQERQASVTPEGVPDAVDPLSPAAQPGLAAPGMGAEAGSTIPAPPAGLDQLSQTFHDLRATSPRMAG